jgi:hypothetical protein
MLPWNQFFNNFFWVTYSTKYKKFTLSWFWKGRVHRIKFTIALESSDLIDDSKYKTQHERYQKEGYAGHIQTKSKQRPHHTGIHYNYNDKQLSVLSPAERQAELDRRETVTRTSGVRHSVG